VRAALAAALAAVALAAADLAGAARPAAADEVQLSREQALALAARAFAAGDAALAHGIAAALAAGDPGDAEALMVLAATRPVLGDAGGGRAAGRAAWAAARGKPALRYSIARHTAKAALTEGRPGLAQIWLRHALDVAPDAAARAQTGADLQRMRAITPLRWQIDVSLSPSSNVNGGAGQGRLVIDGRHDIGSLGGWSLARPGTAATLGLAADLALPPGAAGQWVVGVAAETRAHRLAAPAAGLDATDLDRTEAEVRLAREMRPGGRPLTLTLTAGQTWEGGARLGPHLALDARRALRLDAGRALWLSAGVERRFAATGARLADEGELRLDGAQALASGGVVRWGLGLIRATGRSVNATRTGVEVSAGFAPGRSLGPVDWQVSAWVGGTWHDRWSLGFAEVTSGRTDRRAGLALDLGLAGAEVMGFQPRLTLSHERTQSNISRFEGTRTAVGLGLRSSF
jgi:hypothetical protein